MSTTQHVFTPPQVDGLTEDDQKLVDGLFKQLSDKQPRLDERHIQYDNKALMQHIGDTVPPHMRNIGVSLGWCAKGVDSFSLRTVLEEVEGDGEAAGLVETLWDENQIATEAPMVHTESLISSVAFLFVTKGGKDEAPALITPQGARHATAFWSTRRRALTDALSVTDYDKVTKQPSEFTFYTSGRAVTCLTDGRSWDIRESTFEGRPPVFPIAFKADLDRPFGRSRITRPMMYLASAAMRTMLRTEVGAEFYNWLQRYVLGADESAFVGDDGSALDRWQVLAGGLLALGRDEDGNLPQVGEFKQQSTEPNHADLRTFAQQFSAESGLPLRSLGVVGDNPESGEAIGEAKEDLVVQIHHWQRTALAPAWQAAFRAAARIAEPSVADPRITARFAPALRVSPQAGADAYVKIASVNPEFAQSEVGLELAGLTSEQIARFQTEQARIRANSLVDRLIAAPEATVDGDEG